MCGIIGEFKKQGHANDGILDQYEEQNSRGTRGFGIALVNAKGEVSVKRATEPVKAIVDLNLYKARSILMHHRLPTSSDNRLDQTHPILVDGPLFKNKYLVVHNGVIVNAKKIKENHDQIKYEYKTAHIAKPFYAYGKESGEEKFNDSEALAVEVADFIENGKEIESTGSAAFVAIQMDQNNKIKKVFFGRNEGNPLKLYDDGKTIKLSSEGKGVQVEANHLFSFNYSGKTFKIVDEGIMVIKEREVYVPSTKYDYGYGVKKLAPNTYKLGEGSRPRNTSMGFNTEDDDKDIPPYEDPTEAYDAFYSDMIDITNDMETDLDVGIEVNPQEYISRMAVLIKDYVKQRQKESVKTSSAWDD